MVRSLVLGSVVLLIGVVACESSQPPLPPPQPPPPVFSPPKPPPPPPAPKNAVREKLSQASSEVFLRYQFHDGIASAPVRCVKVQTKHNGEDGTTLFDVDTSSPAGCWDSSMKVTAKLDGAKLSDLKAETAFRTHLDFHCEPAHVDTTNNNAVVEPSQNELAIESMRFFATSEACEQAKEPEAPSTVQNAHCFNQAIRWGMELRGKGLPRSASSDANVKTEAYAERFEKLLKTGGKVWLVIEETINLKEVKKCVEHKAEPAKLDPKDEKNKRALLFDLVQRTKKPQVESWSLASYRYEPMCGTVEVLPKEVGWKDSSGNGERNAHSVAAARATHYLKAAPDADELPIDDGAFYTQAACTKSLTKPKPAN